MPAVDGDPDLLVRRSGGAWASPAVSAYGNEAELRDLLAAQPTLLPGIGPGAAAAVTELYVPGAGYLDVTAVDESGRLALAECKLASNPEVRRRVIGQALAYAAGLWRWSYDEFDAAWSARAGRGVVESVVQDEEGDISAATIREGVSDALLQGRFSLVLAVDAITPELQRVVEYLNAQTIDGVSILAFELRYARERDIEIITPRVFGAELAASRTRVISRARWTEEDVVEGFATAGEASAGVATEILEHYRERVARLYFGEGRRPSVTLVFETPFGRTQPSSLWATDPPSLSPDFEYTTVFPAEARRAFAASIARIAGTALDPAAIEEAGFAKRPGVRVPGVFDQPGATKELIGAIDRLLSTPVPDRDSPTA